ncbi:hypothetical protein [Rhizomonospora bruguierae]|uniref:hypothetical protein n=1 Tax=Rhizomonospora bruguierae TaxID=1581705 RepID=UPI001BCF68D8|nr:hypothetical protein [Micromonospora sp. NBRC 107566]
MTAARPERAVPRTAGELLGRVLAGLVIGVAIAVAFDALLSLLGNGRFGHSSGWLALVLPGWLYLEEFRAEPPGPIRVVVALVGAAVAVAAGLLAAGIIGVSAPPLVSGAAGAAVSALGYGLIWYHGVRWLAHRTGGGA